MPDTGPAKGVKQRLMFWMAPGQPLGMKLHREEIREQMGFLGFQFHRFHNSIITDRRDLQRFGDTANGLVMRAIHT